MIKKIPPESIQVLCACRPHTGGLRVQPPEAPPALYEVMWQHIALGVMLKQDPMKYARTEARRRARPQERRLRLLPIGVSKTNMMDGGNPYNNKTVETKRFQIFNSVPFNHGLIWRGVSQLITCLHTEVAFLLWCQILQQKMQPLYFSSYISARQTLP